MIITELILFNRKLIRLKQFSNSETTRTYILIEYSSCSTADKPLQLLRLDGQSREAQEL